LNWIDRLQQRFGSYAIPGLGRYIVSLQVLCFAIGLAQPDLLYSMVLFPSKVAAGEYWRLFTFLCIPSLSPLQIFMAIFVFMFQWTVFEGLEAEWGAFRLNLYCLIGWICVLALPMGVYAFTGVDWPASANYWGISIALAFAILYPEFTIYVYFILPVKMRWAAWLIGAYLVWRLWQMGLLEALPMAVGLLNFLLFLGPSLVARAKHAQQVQEGRQVFRAAAREAERTLAPRACVQCSAGPDAELRLCSCARCGEDGKLWCAAHLPGHLATLPIAPEASTPEAPRAPVSLPVQELAAPKTVKTRGVSHRGKKVPKKGLTQAPAPKKKALPKGPDR
jgi:hypothetical protein